VIDPNARSGSGPENDHAPQSDAPSDPESTDAMAFAAVALSGAGFLTLLKLADRRERTPFRALALFLATSFESVGGTVLGLKAVGRAQETGSGLTRSSVMGAAGAVLGVITTLLNVNWMRTRRRM
jgi:hypothetical protein